MVGVAVALLRGEGVHEVDACPADLLAAAEGSDPVVDGGGADAEGLGDLPFSSLDGGLGVACGGGLDEGEAFVDARDPDVVLDLFLGDGACESVEFYFSGLEGDAGEAVATVLGEVDVALGGVGGGGLDDLAVGGADARCLYEGLEEGGGGGVGGVDVDVAGGVDVASCYAAVCEGLDVAVCQGFHEGQGFSSEGFQEVPSLLGVADLGCVCRLASLRRIFKRVRGLLVQPVRGSLRWS